MENEKLYIIEKISEKFLTQGAKSVTMDDVCGICGISKKTLYVYFPNKEVLLEEMLNFVSNSIMNDVEEIQNQNHHPIEEMFIIHERIYTLLRSNDDVFMNQLMKFYPEIHCKHCETKFEKMMELLNKNITKGIEKNIYRTDFNIDLIIRFFFSLNYAIKGDDLFSEFRSNSKKLHYSLLIYHIQSILTDLGRMDFEQIEKKYHTNSNI